jgi:hypothetical protein
MASEESGQLAMKAMVSEAIGKVTCREGQCQERERSVHLDESVLNQGGGARATGDAACLWTSPFESAGAPGG